MVVYSLFLVLDDKTNEGVREEERQITRISTTIILPCFIYSELLKNTQQKTCCFSSNSVTIRRAKQFTKLDNSFKV